ncbi:MAG: DUF5668 domain-containing protein [Bacteroidales bacterium]|jgi:hypothetical protein|nr:DUF5668 domain-containing protein [Bacteroidales bacterium]
MSTIKSGYAGKLFAGIALITIGIIWLLSSLDVINLNWRDIWHLWPLIVVWIGISLLPIPEIYRLLLNILTLGIGLLMLLLPHIDKSNRLEWNEVTIVQDNKWQTDPIGSNNTCFLYDKASLDLSIGASTLIFDTSRLLVATAGSEAFVVSVNSDTITRTASVAVTSAAHNILDNRAITLKLNPNPVWDMNLNIGDCSGTINLTPFKVQNLELNAGATHIVVRLGDRADKVKAEISAGASDITLEVPKTMRCIIEKEAAFISSNFKGFKKQNGKYVAEAEGISKGTVFIEIEAGVSQIQVKRY